MDKLIAILGQPTKTFNGAISGQKSHWWALVDYPLMEKAREIEPMIHTSPVYARPELVDGGQKFDVNFCE